VGLSEYNRKRDFGITSEPSGEAPAPPRKEGLRHFVIQKHAASRLHYDFRLELEGVLKSWSVPKGPSLDTKVKRLAMHVEDHPLAYAEFEGIIPKGQYGGGTVLLWDRGTWEPVGDPHQSYAAGNLKFILKGEKLQGGFALVKLRGRGPQRGKDQERAWLLIKERDGHVPTGEAGDVTAARPESVATGRTLDDIATDRSRVWHSNRAQVDAGGAPGARRGPLPARLRPPRFAARPIPPRGAGWLHEMAIAGERLLARNDGATLQLLDEDGKPLTAAAARKRGAIADAVRMLPAQTLVVDGILAAMTPAGHSDARALPGALAGKALAGKALADKTGATLAYFVFDLIHLDGFDLTRVPLDRRKALLAELVRASAEPGALRYLDHIAGDGVAFQHEARRLGIAAMVSRRADSSYGARAGWTRIPCAFNATG
jgi:bifunctional non-homologous end joining protein LigD